MSGETLWAHPDLTCPHCGSDRLEQISQTPKRSWKELFWRESDTCPWWYADRQRDDHRRFWTEAYGVRFLRLVPGNAGRRCKGNGTINTRYLVPRHVLMTLERWSSATLPSFGLNLLLGK